MHRVSQMLSHIFFLNKYRSITLILLSVTILTQASPIFAVSIHHSKMRRDLNIAEEALKQILQYEDSTTKSKSSLETDQIRSAYIKDYGVLFIVNASSSGARSFQIGDQVKVNIKRSESGETAGAHISNHVKLPMKKLENVATVHIQASDIPFSEDGKKSRLTEFLQTYASTIGQLKDSDNIAVVLDTKINTFRIGQMISETTDHQNNKTFPIHKIEDFIHQHRSRLSTSDAPEDSVKKMSHLLNKMEHHVKKQKRESDIQTQSDTLTFKKYVSPDGQHVRVRIVSPDSVGTPEPMHFSINNGHQKVNDRSLLQASIRKSDLSEYQRGSLSNKNFTAKINFQTLPGDTTVIKKVDIFSGIIDKSLGSNQDGPLNISNKALGTYIPSLGAIFFVQKTDGPVDLKFLRNTMVEVFADYGASLRDVKPNEEVIIYIHNEYPHYAFRRVHRVILKDNQNFATQEDISEELDATKALPNKFPADLTIRVQKKYLNDYTAGKIDLKKLREKITITGY